MVPDRDFPLRGCHPAVIIRLCLQPSKLPRHVLASTSFVDAKPRKSNVLSIDALKQLLHQKVVVLYAQRSSDGRLKLSLHIFRPYIHQPDSGFGEKVASVYRVSFARSPAAKSEFTRPPTATQGPDETEQLRFDQCNIFRRPARCQN